LGKVAYKLIILETIFVEKQVFQSVGEITLYYLSLKILIVTFCREEVLGEFKINISWRGLKHRLYG